MADLDDLVTYLKDRIRVLGECEQRLESLQQKFDTFNAEVQGAREHELDQLVELTTTQPETLPEDYRKAIAAGQPDVEREFDAQVAALEKQRTDLVDTAEELRQESARNRAELRNRNLSLDEEEERLKHRSTVLVHEIGEHNERIAELGRSFGFFLNFFRMRRLAKENEDLETKQRDVLARIEGLRRSWREADHEYAEREEERRQDWLQKETDAAAVAAKIEVLKAQHGRIVARTTVERVLVSHEYNPPMGGEGDPPCLRCGMSNPPTNHFCHICARRIGDDRKDLEGSLLEFAELDHHARRFGEGMRACQGLIGLVRGMKSGLEGLAESVGEMRASQYKHKLKKLSLEVPQWSRNFGARFDDLFDLAHKEMRLHPLDLAHTISQQTDIVFTEPNITAYFELIGAAMSQAAEAQWGS